MKAQWRTERLGDVCTIVRDAIQPEDIDDGTSFVGLENITGDGEFNGLKTVDRGEIASTKFAFGPSHVLYGKLRPYLRKIARPSFEGVCSTDILPLEPSDSLNRDFLFHYLRQPELVEFATTRCTGANLPRLSPKTLAEFEIPLPSLSEQKRIAGILDQAEGLRRKRQQALALTDQFLRSTFLDLFGDPVTNSKRWPIRSLLSMLLIPLRNGLSPSTAGTVRDRVLTLSAITQGDFNPEAIKDAPFVEMPPSEKRVDRLDFLICRGNGNLHLCGVGRFPNEDMRNVVFPDTMIAARFNPDFVSRHFIESLWGTQSVRDQIEKGARTTNGTYKVNQQVLEAIQLVIPPRNVQERFENISAKVSEIQKRFHLAQVNSLFNSLVQRAFRGDL